MELKNLISYNLLETADPILYSQVTSVYEMVKETINSISGCFNNYTMHDMGHGLRVANYMEQLAFGIDEEKENKAKKFNAAEYAILILSAILHDIGMFISPKDKEEIKSGKIKYSDTLTFQGVLDVKKGNEEEAIKEIVRLTHAARINEFLEWKFTDRSQTISEILSIDNKYPYAEDVALICQAHGENYDFIKNKVRETTTKGKYEYNPQYFAVLLRIADYLDLDKQRTPMLWFSIMGIEGFSKSEWETHFQISNEKKLKDYFDGKLQIYFDGKSSNAKIHRKYLKYIDNLTKEVVNADDFLNHKNAISRYKLNVSTKIDNLVKTEGFDYSDLRLSLDYAAITELLMGKNIYGDSRLGLRELMQNSIDACKLMNEVKSDYTLPFAPSIHITISKTNNYVKIWDTGIGMTMDVVKNHFLNIGKSYYKSNEYLFNNYKYKPIGQYGIGFLACFLLSDNVIVKTKHYKSNQIYQIELEKNSEYVVTNTEESSLFYGTEIQLEYASFFKSFKDKEDLKNFISNFFDTTIPIYFCDKDMSDDEELITNKNLELLKQIVDKSKKSKQELVDCSKYSTIISGNIVLKAERERYKQKIECLGENNKYVFNSEKNLFEKIETVQDGRYNLIQYVQLKQEEYESIRKTSRDISGKSKALFALAKEKGSTILLLTKVKDDFPFPNYFYDLESAEDKDLETIFKNSNIPFYPELFYYQNISAIYVMENEFIHLYGCGLYNEMRFGRVSSLEKEFAPTYLYYKDILVKDFRFVRAFLPYAYEIFGYINYKGKDLKLDVSRNEIIGGNHNINVEFNKTLLKYKKEKEKDIKVGKFLEKILEYYEKGK